MGVTQDYPDYSSPCVRVCRLDPATEICIGCYRTLDEISYWTRYTNAQRQAIREAIPQREIDFKNRSNSG
jgi:hypothetical protein